MQTMYHRVGSEYQRATGVDAGGLKSQDHNMKAENHSGVTHEKLSPI